VKTIVSLIIWTVASSFIKIPILFLVWRENEYVKFIIQGSSHISKVITAPKMKFQFEIRNNKLNQPHGM